MRERNNARVAPSTHQPRPSVLIQHETTMNPTINPTKRPSTFMLLFARIAVLFAAVLAPAQAEAAGAGRVTGRIFAPATGEYVRNAEVRIQGTNFVALSESDGSFEFTSVPAGTVTLVVS